MSNILNIYVSMGLRKIDLIQVSLDEENLNLHNEIFSEVLLYRDARILSLKLMEIQKKTKNHFFFYFLSSLESFFIINHNLVADCTSIFELFSKKKKLDTYENFILTFGCNYWTTPNNRK